MFSSHLYVAIIFPYYNFLFIYLILISDALIYMMAISVLWNILVCASGRLKYDLGVQKSKKNRAPTKIR